MDVAGARDEEGVVRSGLSEYLFVLGGGEVWVGTGAEDVGYAGLELEDAAEGVGVTLGDEVAPVGVGLGDEFAADGFEHFGGVAAGAEDVEVVDCWEVGGVGDVGFAPGDPAAAG